MEIYNLYFNISSAKAAEMERRALVDDKYLRSLVADGWRLSLPLQRRLLEQDSLRIIESYVENHQLSAETECLLCEIDDDDLIGDYIDRYATLLGRTMLSQEFILKLLDLSSGEKHLKRCIRKGVWLSPKVQVKMLKKEYGQDALLYYLAPYSKYVKYRQESEKTEIPLCRSAQCKLVQLPNAKEVIWFLTKTWKLCPRAEQLAKQKGLM